MNLKSLLKAIGYTTLFWGGALFLVYLLSIAPPDVMLIFLVGAMLVAPMGLTIFIIYDAIENPICDGEWDEDGNFYKNEKVNKDNDSVNKDNE